MAKTQTLKEIGQAAFNKTASKATKEARKRREEEERQQKNEQLKETIKTGKKPSAETTSTASSNIRSGWAAEAHQLHEQMWNNRQNELKAQREARTQALREYRDANHQYVRENGRRTNQAESIIPTARGSSTRTYAGRTHGGTSGTLERTEEDVRRGYDYFDKQIKDLQKTISAYENAPAYTIHSDEDTLAYGAAQKKLKDITPRYNLLSEEMDYFDQDEQTKSELAEYSNKKRFLETGYSDEDKMSKAWQDEYAANEIKRKDIQKRIGADDQKMDALTDYAMREYNKAQAQDMENFAKQQNPVGNVAANALTVLNNFAKIKDLPAVTQAIIKDLPVDVNAMNATNFNDAIRGETSERILKSKVAPGLLNFLYQSGMSMADFGAMIPLDLATGGGALSLALMGTSAGMSAVKEATGRGMSPMQAFDSGIAAGIFEALFERVSLEALLNPSASKGAIEYILKNVMSEGSEEVCTDMANMIFDRLRNGGMSEYNQNVLAYMNGPQRMTEKEARKQAAIDFAQQLGISFAGGALSGGIMAGMSTMSKGTRAQFKVNQYENLQQQNAQAITEMVEGTRPFDLEELTQRWSQMEQLEQQIDTLVNGADNTPSAFSFNADSEANVDTVTSEPVERTEFNTIEEAQETQKAIGEEMDNLSSVDPRYEELNQRYDELDNIIENWSDLNESERNLSTSVGRESEQMGTAVESSGVEGQSTETGAGRPGVNVAETAAARSTAIQDAGVQKVSTREIVGEIGTDTQGQVAEVTEDVWKTLDDADELQAIKDECDKYGIDVHFASGLMEVNDNGRPMKVDGIQSTDGTRWITIDSSEKTASQINGHEDFHAYLDSATSSKEERWDVLDDLFEQAAAASSPLDVLEDLENQVIIYYGDQNALYNEDGTLNDDLYYYELEELMANAHGNIDIAKGEAKSQPSRYGETVRKSVEANRANTRRGPPSETKQADPFKPAKAVTKELASNGVELIDGSAVKTSRASWERADKQNIINGLVKAGFTKADAQAWVNDVNGIAAIIANDMERLDYVSADNHSMLKPNAEYVTTLDASTLCAKRLLYQGTYNAIAHELGNRPLMAEDVIKLRNMMDKAGLEVPCGICYVESRRKALGKFASEWLDTYKGKYIPTLDEVVSSDGLENLRKTHSDTYDDFIKAMNKKGTVNPKVVELRAEYDGEILKLTKGQIKKEIRIGGQRVQSFSDFETPHLIDMMQAVIDMAQVGLTSQAYTKVPNFAWVFGDTGIKINLSLIGDVDSKGKLTFDNKEGMPFEEAMKLRDAYSKNVGTILVGKNDAHILAAMADDRIDFIIPFHRSGWGKADYEALGLSGYEDYTNYQNEKMIDGSKSPGNLYPIDYWDYSKSGKENAEIYLKLCKEQGRIPKFSNFLVDNGDGSWSLQPDGSTDGYWKTLIDFKMYDNAGVGAPQMAVTPNFNMEQANRVLSEYKGGANSLPVADDIVKKFVAEYKTSRAVDAGALGEYRDGLDDVYDLLSKVEPFDLEYEQVVDGLGSLEENIDQVYDELLEENVSEDEINRVKQVAHWLDEAYRDSKVKSDEIIAAIAREEDAKAGKNDVRLSRKADDNEQRIYELDEQLADLRDKRELADGNEYKVLSNEIVKLQHELDTLHAEERKEAVKTSLSTILENLDNYRRLDLISLGNQLTDSAWDGLEEMKADDIRQGIREIIEEREYSPLEMQTKSKGLYVRPVDQDIRYSRSIELEQEYEDAYFDGDDDRMQEILDEYAASKGYNYKGYHHTENAFTVFDRSKARKSMDIEGFYFSADPEAEREYGSARYDTYLKMQNPYVVDSMEKMKGIPWDNRENAGVRAREWLQKNGYDGVIRDAEFFGAEADEYIVFEPEQIKSMDPVTYADDEYGEGDFIPLSERFNESNPDIRYSRSTDAVEQKISSAKTSIKQIPALFKNKNVSFGDTNIDIGGGRFDLATNYLAEQGTKNMVFDPYNRDAKTNRKVIDFLQSGKKADTATCANVLNVIAEKPARENVILEVAKSIKPDGKAYFMVYEGNGSGVGRETSAGYQNNRKTADYVSEIEEYFNDVTRKGKLIIAEDPKEDLPAAAWEVQPGEAIRFSRDTDEDLVSVNRKLRNQIDTIRKQRDYWRAQTHRSIPSATQQSANKMAKAWKEQTGSTMTQKDIAAKFKELGDWLRSGSSDITILEARNRSRAIAKELLDTAKVLREDFDRQAYTGIKKSLMKAMTISPQDASNIPDYEDWRKSVFGKVNIRKGTSGYMVDQAYQQLNEEYPDWFPADITNPADQLLHMADVYESIQPIYENPYDRDYDEALNYAETALLEDAITMDTTAPTYADRKEAEIDTLRRKANEKLTETRQKHAEEIAELKERYKQAAAEKRARQQESNNRTRLLKIARRLRNRKMPAVTRAVLEQYIGDLDLIAKSMTGATEAKLEALQDWYKEQAKSDDFIPNPYIEAKLERLHKKQINELTALEVADLTDILLNIEHELRTKDKFIKSELAKSTYAAGQQVIADVENTNGKGKTEKLITGMLSPERLARRVTGYREGDPLYQVFRELSKGANNQQAYQYAAERQFTNWTHDKKFTENFAGPKAQEISLDMIGMPDVVITPAMRASLWLHSLNPDNLRHITYGGVTIPDMKLYRKGKIQEAYDAGKTIKLKPSQVRAITSQMTGPEKAYAQAASKYFNETSHNAINEVSEAKDGFSIANVENYFPIDTDKTFLKSEIEELKRDGTIEGMGFTKQRIHATNPIMLYDMDTVLNRSISQHAKYVGLAIPVRNFNKLWTVGTYIDDQAPNSVQKAIISKWGRDSYDYITKVLTDIQSPTSTKDDISKILGGVRSKYAQAVLELNASVAIKQSASYPTAAAVLGWKPLLKAMGNIGKVNLDTVYKYSPMQAYREKGFASQELGEITSRKGKTPAVLNWIQFMDAETTRKLWKASEYYVRDNFPNLKVGSEEYLQKVGEIHTKVLEETQPNYTVMQRPQFLRSDSDLTKTLMMFKTQPFQNFNILYDATEDLKAKYRAYKNGGSKADYKTASKTFAKAVSSQLVASFVFAMMQYAWDRFRKKDDKYKNDEGDFSIFSQAKGIGINMLGNGFGMLPFGSEILEQIETRVDKILQRFGADAFFDARAYGLSDSIVEQINNTVKAVNSINDELLKIGSDDFDWKESLKTTKDAMLTLAQFAGVPAKNVNNLIQAAKDNIDAIVNGEDPESFQHKQKTATKYVHKLPEWKELDEKQRTKVDREITKYAQDTGSNAAAEYVVKNKPVPEGLRDTDAGKITTAKDSPVDANEYFNFRVMLWMVDRPTDSGTVGSFNQSETMQALQKAALSDRERRYIWNYYYPKTDYDKFKSSDKYKEWLKGQ